MNKYFLFFSMFFLAIINGQEVGMKLEFAKGVDKITFTKIEANMNFQFQYTILFRRNENEGIFNGESLSFDFSKFNQVIIKCSCSFSRLTINKNNVSGLKNGQMYEYEIVSYINNKFGSDTIRINQKNITMVDTITIPITYSDKPKPEITINENIMKKVILSGMPYKNELEKLNKIPLFTKVYNKLPQEIEEIKEEQQKLIDLWDKYKTANDISIYELLIAIYAKEPDAKQDIPVNEKLQNLTKEELLEKMDAFYSTLKE